MFDLTWAIKVSGMVVRPWSAGVGGDRLKQLRLGGRSERHRAARHHVPARELLHPPPPMARRRGFFASCDRQVGRADEPVGIGGGPGGFSVGEVNHEPRPAKERTT
jgi:hypothetical protein